MRAFHFYALATGIFTGASSSTTDHGMAPPPPPEGQGAFEGDADWQSQRLDLASGDLVDYTPPPPPLEDLKADATSAITARIDDIESRQIGALRELVLALAAAAPATLDAAAGDTLASLQAEHAQIADLQDAIAAVAKAVDADAVDAVTAAVPLLDDLPIDTSQPSKDTP